jgi:hypothetical protein
MDSSSGDWEIGMDIYIYVDISKVLVICRFISDFLFSFCISITCS